MRMTDRCGHDVASCQRTARKYLVIFLAYFVISLTTQNIVLAELINQPTIRAVSNDDRDDSLIDSSETRNVKRAEGEAEVHIEDKDRNLSSGSDVRETDGKTSGQCRVLSLNDAAALLAGSSAFQSTESASHDIQRYLEDLGQRIATRTIVLCKAVTVAHKSPDIASLQILASQYTTTTEALGEQKRQPRPIERPSDDLEERVSDSMRNRDVIGKSRERSDSMKHFRSVGDVSNPSGSGTIHHLRHRRHRYRQERKHIRASPFNRKYFWRRSRRTPGGCADDDVTEELDVERVMAIMKAFNCWDDKVAWLASQLQQSADEHLQVTLTTSQLRCRLMRRYDNCRRNFIDKVFRTEHGLAISWPGQITDVMDRDDYSAIYY